MATLVLTAVGTAVGGPIGGLIGTVVGGAIDRQIFAAKPREGPRLTDLRLQTSTYGSAIPRIYGRVRVAGTVIWATDLKESKAKSGGKGSPKTVSFSYSALFAVALSSRVAGRIGRIWADGKLLRGAAGDFKSATRFRFASGDDDQPVDSLIAGAVGMANCPAHRGIAYAVFEDMALADYGNRIPALTFELIADEGAVTVGSVVRDLLPARFDAASEVALAGYAAEGSSIAAAIGPLVLLGGLVRSGSAEAPLLTAAIGPAVSVTPAAPITIERTADGAVPQPVTLRYYDPARDYQTGAQRANIAGDEQRATQIDLPAVLAAGQAQAAAERIVRARLAAATSATLRSAMGALALRPGSAVVVPGQAGTWRIVASEIDATGVTLNLARVAAGDPLAPGQGAAPGEPVIERDLPIAPTRWHFVDLPAIAAMTGASPVRIAVAGEAPGWRGADISIEGGAADGEPVARIVRESTIGSAVTALAPASAALFDALSSVEVELLHAEMALNGASDAAMLAGRNAAMIGDEPIQFGRAVQLSPTRWRIERLLRGRGGSEAAVGAHMAGEMFVLIEADALGEIDRAQLAGGGHVAVAGLGDQDPAARIVAGVLRADRPLAPVHGRWSLAANGSVTLDWTRRSRVGLAWSDGIDAPLGEDRELYRITHETAGGGEILIVESESPLATIPAATLSAAGGAMTLRIRQVGSLALSGPLEMHVANA